jgi:uncharacterized membrane protein YcaP (DUF421 family)
MERWIQLDWAELLTLKMSVAEIAVRGVAVYFGLCVLLRVVPKRQAGKAGITDLLFVILLGGIAVDGIAKQAESLTDFFAVLVTVLLVGYGMDWLAFKYRWFRNLVLEPPTCLIRDGRVLHTNLRREMVTEEDLMSQLRRQDVDDPRCVQEAYLEADGEISVIRVQNGAAPGRPTAVPRSEACTDPDAPEPAAPDPRLNGAHRPGEKPTPDADHDAVLRDFLAAAGRLQARLDWHRQRAAEYREALARYGVRTRRTTEAKRAQGRERPRKE